MSSFCHEKFCGILLYEKWIYGWGSDMEGVNTNGSRLVVIAFFGRLELCVLWHLSLISPPPTLQKSFISMALIYIGDGRPECI